MKKVKVTPDKAGQAIILSTNNPEFGFVRVEQTRTTIDDNGWVKNKPVAALILGSVAELRKAGFTAGQELDGKIVIREQLTPFNKNAPEKDLKVAGKTGITCMVNEQPIYRKAFYSQDANAQDVLIAHTNVEVIKAAYAKALEAAKASDLAL